MKKLKTLAEHNAEVEQKNIDAKRNGIACDKCGEEMCDSHLMDFDDRIIFCPKWEYQTTRLVEMSN